MRLSLQRYNQNKMNIEYSRIYEWYDAHGRKELPWRNTDEAYRIYLSEVMLQQTQVNTVLERYYHPFLKRFPTLKLLGDAPLEAVLKAWEGLGYYNRAKNLHKTAQLTGGVLPSSIDELIKLPGIGKNTAHAIAAFAFHQPVPVMEANVRRILLRFFAMQCASEKELWQRAYTIVDKNHPFEYNQAMMDIGAMVCRPKAPLCDACPLSSGCLGKSNPEHYGVKKRKQIPTKRLNIVLYKKGEKLGLYRRTGAFLHGLWSFPECDMPPKEAQYVGSVKHAYSHFKLECSIYLIETRIQKKGLAFYDISHISKIPISKIDEKILCCFLNANSF